MSIWTDVIRVDKMADPDQAMEDVRAAHAWATQELTTVEPQSPRAWILAKERQRLADIAWRLRRMGA